MANPARKVRAPRPQNGTKSQEWETPMALFREIERRFARGGFTLDAAATVLNAKCAHISHRANALADGAVWQGRVFVNPPYFNIEPWVLKAQDQVEAGEAEVVVLLLPARTGSEWYAFCQRHAWHIEHIRGRVHFLPAPGEAAGTPFEDSIVVVFQRPLVAAEWK